VFDKVEEINLRGSKGPAGNSSNFHQYTKEVRGMMPKLQMMVIRKPETKCSEKLDCHERHNCRTDRQKVVKPSRIRRFAR